MLYVQMSDTIACCVHMRCDMNLVRMIVNSMVDDMNSVVAVMRYLKYT